MMGIRLDEPFPLYPDGFPPEIVEPFEDGDRPPDPGQRARVGDGDHRGAGRGAPPHGRTRSCTRAGTPSSRSRRHKDVVPLPTLYEWCRVGATAADGSAHGRPGHRPAVRGPDRERSSDRPSGGTSPCRLRARRCSTASRRPTCPCTGSARSATSSPDRGSRRAGTRTRTTTAIELTLDYLQRPCPGVRVHEPRGLRLEVRASQRPRRVREGDRGVRPAAPGPDRRARRRRPVHHRRPRLRPDHAIHGPHAGADAAARRRAAGRAARDRHARSRSAISDTRSPHLLGVEVEGLEGESFADRIGLGR